ncbi:hypothetical protein [Falsibacillus albus]|uniref:Uncharacterized protein n=1 Tax=Falsibacillus albus TaxID=2478915 RepID=A0A3L7JPN3_9BACI|nr:hypothetical protein [Falsibacillus albus]RLQ92284.1 hypothetical protein D9X91_19600 [Falsibacillus albus]
MFISAYAASRDEKFPTESLKVYRLLHELLNDKALRKDDGYRFLPYREIWESGIERGLFTFYEDPFAVMMDMLTVMEEAGLVMRKRVTGGSWFRFL